jgi:hypothetical protein
MRGEGQQRQSDERSVDCGNLAILQCVRPRSRAALGGDRQGGAVVLRQEVRRRVPFIAAQGVGRRV